MGVASLAGVPFRIDPDAVAWDFRAKTSVKNTVGGQVVQVYGTYLSDVTVTGAFGNGDRDRGDREGWQEQLRFRAQVEAWSDRTIAGSGAQPLRFLYPPRRWDLRVLIKDYTAPGGGLAIQDEEAVLNPLWQLTLFVVEDSAGTVVSGVQDLYVRRLMAGIGWKQSQYNGPTQEAVDAKLEPFGGDLRGYLAEQFNEAAGFHRGDPQTATDDASTTGTVGGDVDSWITRAGQALSRTFTASERAGLKIIIKYESNGDPKAQNNSAAGQAAGGPKGLMQTVTATFQANALPGHGNIFDPVDNIIAAVRYIDGGSGGGGRYGSIDNVPGVKSVRAGRGYLPY
jgi:transglycosylase-like protein with SLT domain